MGRVVKRSDPILHSLKPSCTKSTANHSSNGAGAICSLTKGRGKKDSCEILEGEGKNIRLQQTQLKIQSYRKVSRNESKGKNSFPGCQMWLQGRETCDFPRRKGFFLGRTDLRTKQSHLLWNLTLPSVPPCRCPVSSLQLTLVPLTPGGWVCSCQTSGVRVPTYPVHHQRWCKQQREKATSSSSQNLC